MKEYKAKPVAAGTLISAEDSNELAKQDARRAAARARGPAALQAALRASILAQVGDEIDATKWGAQADVANIGYGEEVVRPIRVKYPPRKFGKLEQRIRSWKNRAGASIFNWPKQQNLRGFIFNEGGRGVIFSHMPECGLPFRLYVAGWVLTLSAAYDRKTNRYGRLRWSFRHN